MSQITQENLPRLVRKSPAPKPGIVHLGPGAFFRAFIAPYTDEAMAKAGGDWGIIAVSLKSGKARDQLRAQACAYTALELGPDGPIARQIEAIAEIMVAPEDPPAIIHAMSQPNIHIVSLTITEKGYCHNPADGQLISEHPNIRHDLQHIDRPRSAIGFIVSALKERRDKGIPPFTVLCCDNLPSNGQLVRGLTLCFAELLSPDLAEWIAQNVSFPSTMVDRITPATTEDNLAHIQTTQGYCDPAAIVHEPFRQWVIEDVFVADRPDWLAAGAQFVESVEAHELMKLRCLNGTHSTLAYLGYLAGFETISQSISEPAFEHFCRYLWADEILPTLPKPKGENLPAYCEALLRRYQNPEIRHRLWQIAMDGSQKLPQRIVAPLQNHLANGHVPKGFSLVIAAWMIYVGGVDEKGMPIDVRDPLAAELKAASQAADPVNAFLSLDAVFDPSLIQKTGLVAEIQSAYKRLKDKGALDTVKAFTAHLS